MLASDQGALPPDLFQATVALLEDLAAISSASGDAAGLERMAARLAATLAARGLDVEVRRGLAEDGVPGGGTPGKGLPVVLARGPAARAGGGHLEGAPAGGIPGKGQPVVPARGPTATTGRGGHLLLVGHLDTVLPAAAPRRDGERLAATGAIDMKGGLATLAGALDLLARRGVAPPADLLVVVVPDEEVGGEISRAAVARWGAEARALWVLEPGEPGSTPGAETLVGGRRGLFDWRLAASGRAAHSGLHLASGRSALLAAARWCLAAADGSLGGEGAAVGATGQAAHGTTGQAAHRGTGSGRPAVNIGRLVAGDASFVTGLATAHAWLGTERQLNVVPDTAIAEGEARFSTVAMGEEVARHLAALAAALGAATGTRLAFTHGQFIPPVDPSGLQRDGCQRAVTLAAARGWRLEVEKERGGISFPNFLPDPGRLPILDGLGPIGGGMHTRDEYVDLTSLARRIVLLADLLEADAAGRYPAPTFHTR